MVLKCSCLYHYCFDAENSNIVMHNSVSVAIVLCHGMCWWQWTRVGGAARMDDVYSSSRK